MLPSSIRDHLLVDEAQLGQRLNRGVQHGDRADFRLHLALLTEAVEEQPWFDAKPAEAATRDWRRHFDLREPELLVGNGQEGDCSAINERLQQGAGMVEVRLWLALQAQPLVPKQTLLDGAVYGNLSALARERLQGKAVDAPRQEDPRVLLPILEQVQQGVDTRLHWLS